jgi:DNA polymerase V
VNRWPVTPRAAKKLRAQRHIAGVITVTIHSNPFKPWEPQYNRSEVVPLPEPSADTRELIRAALWGLRRIYRTGFAYKKAGVMLSGLEPEQRRQSSLLADPEHERKSSALMQAMDRINERWGRGSLQPLATGFDTRWRMRRERLSPAWTTRWDDLPRVAG